MTNELHKAAEEAIREDGSWLATNRFRRAANPKQILALLHALEASRQKRRELTNHLWRWHEHLTSCPKRRGDSVCFCGLDEARALLAREAIESGREAVPSAQRSNSRPEPDPEGEVPRDTDL